MSARYSTSLLVLCRRSERRPGYGNSITVFAPLLREAGMDEGVLGAIQRDNPRRFLAFVPATG